MKKENWEIGLYKLAVISELKATGKELYIEDIKSFIRELLEPVEEPKKINIKKMCDSFAPFDDRSNIIIYMDCLTRKIDQIIDHINK